MGSISIIGLGNMAGALAGRALAGGNAVEIIGRDPAKAKELAAALGSATVGTPGAAPAGDIVILAVPYASAATVVSEYGDALHGKVIIDITNPVNADFTGFVTSDGSSGAQEIAKAAPEGAHVVNREPGTAPDGHRAAANGADTGERLPAGAGPSHSLRQAHQFLPRRQHSQLSAPASHFSRHITPVDLRHEKDSPFHLI
ncbi:NAD(P)-binding domain-containing protein [Actinoplanes sp. NPDC051513]|uniref:NAD(P)-binding domain-containing protein n=1 Tax=Actinoplanes sp. NPDC051513 TaxID=3363908 RepID=UPI0037B55790